MDREVEGLRQRINVELVRRDWSARKASLRAGLGSSTLTNFLNPANEGRGLDPETCRKLAALFEWNVDEVLALAGHRPRLRLQSANPLLELRRVLSMGNVWPVEAQGALLTMARLTMREP